MTLVEGILLAMLVLAIGVIALMCVERRLERAVRRAIPAVVRRGQPDSPADRPNSYSLDHVGVRDQLNSPPGCPAAPTSTTPATPWWTRDVPMPPWWTRDVPMPDRPVQRVDTQDGPVHANAPHLDNLAANAHPGNREPAAGQRTPMSERRGCSQGASATQPDPHDVARRLGETIAASLSLEGTPGASTSATAATAPSAVSEQRSGHDDGIRAILEYDKSNGLEADAWARRRGDVLRVKPSFGPVFEIAAREARCLAAQLLRGADEIAPLSSESRK